MAFPPGRETIVENLVTCCAKSKKLAEVLKKVNRRRKYTEIAQIVGISPKSCHNMLRKLESHNLIKKRGRGVYEKIPILRYINIDSEIRKYLRSRKDVVEKIRVRVGRKRIDTEHIQKQINSYFKCHFAVIKHPFNKECTMQLSNTQIGAAAKKFLEILKYPIMSKKIEGLDLRFVRAFADYFSLSRLDKAGLISLFSSLIRLYEPFLKKLAAIKDNNVDWLNSSLNQKLIEKVCAFNSRINETKENYWKTKNVKEASIRYVYPYRHIESHEARDYTVFEMEKITYYMFASLLLICLENS